MFFIYSITLFSVFFVQFSLIILSNPSRTNCYKSFTYPPIYLNVTHSNPTGPLYFTALFYYERYSVIPHYGLQTEKAIYNFKKIDKLCNSSILFTTMGEDIKELNVEIEIYLFKNRSRIYTIYYNFYPGFNPGNYELIDAIQDFSINIKIPDVAGLYLTTRMRLFYEDESYLSSISGGDGDLCILNEINEIVILNPNYKYGIPSGFVFQIEVDISKNGNIIESNIFAAFECKSDKNYKKDPVILIMEQKNYKASYKMEYVKYIEGKPQLFKQNFEIIKPKYEYVHNIKYISPKYKRFVLINLKYNFNECPDGSESLVIYFEEGQQYISRIMKVVNFSAEVEYKKYFPRSTQDPCNE